MTEVTVHDLLSGAIAQLQNAEIASARLDASLLLAHTLGKDRHFIMLYPAYGVEASLVDKFQQLIERRAKNEPVAYLIGKKEFWSLDFTVTCDTLIPRPDSETLVQAVFDKVAAIALHKSLPPELQTLRIADIGTGTGCLLISVLKGLPLATGMAIDIHPGALDVAKHNAQLHGVNGRIAFRQSNWLENIREMFDIIISNPPYITQSDYNHLMKDVRDYEPQIALVAGDDGLDAYHIIASQALERLNHQGYLLVEVGYAQAEQVSEIFTRQGLRFDEIRYDLAGIARCVIVQKTT